MATLKQVKIHPAIGIARVGNSDQYYFGPETVGAPPTTDASTGTADGFKETNEKIRKQAARFRVYGYYSDGSCREITSREAKIEWTVHVKNKKAVTRNPKIDDETRKVIDPGLVRIGVTSGLTTSSELRGSISLGDKKNEKRDVVLGRVEIDRDGRLVVLGGKGIAGSFDNAKIEDAFDNPKWYDDVSDGPITVTVTPSGTSQVMRSTAWVVVAPPKFSPDFENPVTLYDKLFQNAREKNRVTAPEKPNYKRDILPVLNRAKGVRWSVSNAFGHHLWGNKIRPDKATQIFDKLKKPGGGGSGTMPDQPRAELTKTQYEMIEKWKNGKFDSSEPPALRAPDELDRSALTACVGAAFFPGIEVGGIEKTPIDQADNFLADDWIRLDHAKVGPGDITQYMAVPWHSDFKACGGNWWPIHRPNEVIRGTNEFKDWDADVTNGDDMVVKWAKLGFVLKHGPQWIEKGRGRISTVVLRTMHLDFGAVAPISADMPTTTAREIVFEVRTGGAAVTLRVDDADLPTHERLTVPMKSVTVEPHDGDQVVQVTIPVLYRTGQTGESVQGELTVHDADTGERWTVTIAASTSAMPRAVTSLVLAPAPGGDPSTSGLLVAASSTFVDFLHETDEVGLVRTTPDGRSPEVVTVTSGDERVDGQPLIASVVEQASPAAAQVERAEDWLRDIGERYDNHSIVAVTGTGTDGGSGLRVRRLDPPTRAGRDGADSRDPRLRAGAEWTDLHRQFLQVLSEIRNTDVLLHTDDVLVPNHEHVVPLPFTELDSVVEVVLLTADPSAIDFRIQSPNSIMVGSERAATEDRVSWSTTNSLARYRVSLPIELIPTRPEGPGNWKAVLRSGTGEDPLLYVLAAHTSSPIGLKVDLDHADVDPGSDFTLRARFTGTSLLTDVHMRAEVTRPDGAAGLLSLESRDIGDYRATVTADAEGAYRVRIRAHGRTPLGHLLQREHTVGVTVGPHRAQAQRFTDAHVTPAPREGDVLSRVRT
jgi:hypothetical protein